ncbi:hypothetical protein BJ742DRAFT_580191 [Cladochytrium replicatum]|nr:hypothetical protein BJ742DRAFT_580191 [Cladochytrium replicatum]
MYSRTLTANNGHRGYGRNQDVNGGYRVYSRNQEVNKPKRLTEKELAAKMAEMKKKNDICKKRQEEIDEDKREWNEREAQYNEIERQRRIIEERRREERMKAQEAFRCERKLNAEWKGKSYASREWDTEKLEKPKVERGGARVLKHWQNHQDVFSSVCDPHGLRDL